jgi:UDP-N-acetylmuramoyl-L-alanyl-D-glutamate--2,6-diaminopimelate ligase
MPGDAILIAGKGHEDYQVIGTTKVSFDDRAEARRALEGRRLRARSG